MKHFYILILLAVALGFSGCESENSIAYGDPQSPRVTFTRDLIDTTYQLDRVSEFSYVSFPFMTNTTVGKVRYQFGDGYAFTDSLYYYNPMSYVYQAPGTHKVIIDVYNEKQDYWGSDTMTCIIRLPEVTLDMLTSAVNISVALAVDKTSPIYEWFKVYRDIEVGISAPHTAASKITWTGNSFNASYLSGSINDGYLKDYQFTGTISNDRQKLESMTVSVYDSAYRSTSTKYGYKLFNLELCGMSDRVIVYRAAYRPLSTFVSDEYLSGEISDVRKLGNIFNLPSLPDIRYSVPYAYVSFTRKQ